MEGTTAGLGDNAPDQGMFLTFYEELIDINQAVKEAVGMRKDFYKRLEGAGIKKAPFLQACKEAEKSGDRREADFAELRRNLAWLGKPLGTQAKLFPDGVEGEDDLTEAQGAEVGPPREVSEHQVHQVSAAGLSAGRAGRERSANPWSPGTYLYQIWDSNWHDGQETLAQQTVPPEAAAAPRRGRPPGSKNRPKDNGGIPAG